MNSRTKILSFSHLAILFILMLLPLLISAQDDSIKNNYQEKFDNFKQSIQNDFETFSSKNDSIFYQFLLQNWKEFELFKDQRKKIPKPKKQPGIDSSTILNKHEIKPLNNKTISKDIRTKNDVPLIYNSLEYAPGYTTISFYGSKIEVQNLNISPFQVTGNVTRKQIADFYKDYEGNSKILKAINLLKEQVFAKKYNDYGYLRLLQETSVKYFKTLNEQVLFTWLALVKSGYDAKVGYNNNNIFLLVNFNVPVYYKSYFINHKKKYYLIPFKNQSANQEKIMSFEAVYPDSLSSLSLIIDKNPMFRPDTQAKQIYYNNQKIKIDYNLNMVDFYQTYPDCDLPIYFSPSLSNISLTSFDNYFDPVLKNKTDTEKINILLDFIQNGFPYATDDEQFGKESYSFAEVTLANPFSDCEDRSILLGQLIKHFTKTDVIGLVYPNHVLLAVNVPDAIDGSYLK